MLRTFIYESECGSARVEVDPTQDSQKVEIQYANEYFTISKAELTLGLIRMLSEAGFEDVTRGLEKLLRLTLVRSSS